MDKKHPITGCRADTLFGLWLMDSSDLGIFVDTAWGIIQSGELEKVKQRSDLLQEKEVEKKRYEVENGIAKVHVIGPTTKYRTSFQSLFGGTATTEVREILRLIRNDPTVKGVLLEMDSPGGTLEGNAEAAEAIAKTNKVKPVWVHAPDKATSAALWMGVSGCCFTCGPAAFVGSLGTMVQMRDSSAATAKSDTKPVLIKTGKYKGIGADGLPITEEDKAELQRIITQANASFVDWVKTHRDLTAEQMTEISTARVFVGTDAKRVGLVDYVCTGDDALDALTKLVNGKPVLRDPGNPKSKPITLSSGSVPTNRSKVMLTEQQLSQARNLPGATSITQENADVVLLQVATDVLAKSNTLTQTVVTKDAQIADLQRQIPAPVNPAVAKQLYDLAVKQIEFAAKEGKILPTQADLMKADLKIGDAYNTAALVPDAAGVSQFDRTMKTLELNKPNGLTKEMTNAQPALRTEPGAPAGATSVRRDMIAKMRQNAGLPAYTEEQMTAACATAAA